jgi:hypothetical protein
LEIVNQNEGIRDEGLDFVADVCETVLECRFWIQGSRFRVKGSGFRVKGSRFRVKGSGFRIHGGIWAYDLGLRVEGSGSWVQDTRSM